MKDILEQLLKVNDIEKAGRNRLSQSRTYLLISFLVLMATLTSGLYFRPDLEHLRLVTDNLFYAIVFFGSYSLTGKGIRTYQETRKHLKGEVGRVEKN